MIICRSGMAGIPTERRSETFTGLVFADPVLQGADGIMVNNVFFAPGARTYWHSHERGQVLSVVSGTGLVCRDGDLIHVLHAGDIIWSPPGERHWHGAAAATSMLHCAISLGTTTWDREVSDEEYSVGTLL
jgi:quercetin dioxygenase-like cupin family protein